jgi:hypothetical protein
MRPHFIDEFLVAEVKNFETKQKKKITQNGWNTMN